MATIGQVVRLKKDGPLDGAKAEVVGKTGGWYKLRLVDGPEEMKSVSARGSELVLPNGAMAGTPAREGSSSRASGRRITRSRSRSPSIEVAPMLNNPVPGKKKGVRGGPKWEAGLPPLPRASGKPASKGRKRGRQEQGEDAPNSDVRRGEESVDEGDEDEDGEGDDDDDDDDDKDGDATDDLSEEAIDAMVSMAASAGLRQQRQQTRHSSDGTGNPSSKAGHSEAVMELDSGLVSDSYLEFRSKGRNLGGRLRDDVLTGHAVDQLVRSRTSLPGAAAEAQNAGGSRKSSTSASDLMKRTRVEKDTSAGKGWFGMQRAQMTPELKRDLQVIKMRNYIDPKKFYKAADTHSPFLQIGTVKEGVGEWKSSRLTKKQRKQTLVDELLADTRVKTYSKNTFLSIQEAKKDGRKKRHAAGKGRKRGR